MFYKYRSLPCMFYNLQYFVKHFIMSEQLRLMHKLGQIRIMWLIDCVHL